MKHWLQVVGIILATCTLGGCAAHGPLIAPDRQTIELVDTPFFAQTDHQCGPAALATLLGASGIPVTPEDLDPLVYLPGRRGSLQIEIQAAPRQFGRLSYRIDSQLEAIVAEIAAGRPVLVLHNYGLPFLPRWHYAVAVGFDAQRDRVVLRSGKTRRQEISAANFMRAWDNAGRWGMVLLRPGELPQTPDKGRFLQAAAAFERIASPGDALTTFGVAVQRWPEEPIAWIGQGTARYRSGQLKDAASDYRQALQLDGANTAARNNLAMTLLDLGCPESAQAEWRRINLSQGDSQLAESVADTRRQIAARLPSGNAPICGSL